MTNGANQHYIPSFVQRPFGIPPPKQVEIWHFGLDQAPERRRIKKTASEDYFYSKRSPDGRPTLDDAITDLESRLSLALRDVRAKTPGDPVESIAAAEIVFHLATRTAHVRSSFDDGASLLLDRSERLFSEPGQVAALIGLDGDAPTDLFRERVVNELASTPELAGLDIPPRLLERLAFMLIKEHQAQLLDESVNFMSMLLRELRAGLTGVVREGHNRALGQKARPDNYEALLRTLKWTVESAPTAGAILPDCVVVTINADRSTNTHLFGGHDGLHAIVMPVSPEKLLVGRRPGFTLADDFDYNAEAARLSHRFFLAPRNDAETLRLHPMIGQRLRPMLEKSIEGVFDGLLPEESDETLGNEGGADDSRFAWHPTSQLNYELSLVGCGDGDTSARIQEKVISLVAVVAKALPLERLDGIVIGDDYSALLRSVNRGWEDARPPRTASPDIGVGIAQMVTVRRSGVTKGLIALSSVVSDALICENADQVEWASRVLVKLLARVAVMGTIDETLPGCLLASAGSGIDDWLYANVDGAPTEYVVSRMVAGLGDRREIASGLRALLTEGVGLMQSAAHEARLAYRRQRDIDKLLDAVLPTVRNVLKAAADFLGHCDSTGEPPCGASGALKDALDHVGLTAWFEFYRGHLERFDQRLGRWTTFEEFIAFNIHVERLLLAIGLLTWDVPEGVWVEVLPYPESGP